MNKKKLTPEQQFFNDKTLEFAKELYDQNDEKLNEAYKGQIKNRDDLLNRIAKILLSYNITDSILKLNAADKKKLYSELSDLIVTNIKSELDFETSLTKEILTSVGKEKFNLNNYVYSLGTDFKLTQLSDDALEKIINAKVEDKLWSDRLYDNKNDICNVLQKEVERFLKGETNVNQIEEKIKDKYDTNAHETKRLVQDNICRVQEGANDVWQQEHNIKYVMYMATLDGKVCANCAQYDGKPFELDKKPVQIPQHPFCRCCYVSLTDKDWHPKMRLDNETKKNVNWQSYEEWKKNYIDNNPERLTNHKMIKNKSSDNKLYEKYKTILGNEIPKTLDDFQRLKYNNSNRWDELKTKYSDSSVKKLLEDNNIELVEKISDKLYSVKNYKPDIKDMKQHAKDNLQNKSDRVNMTSEKAKEFIDNAKLVVFDSQRNTIKFMAKDGYSVLNFDNDLVTAVPQKWRNKYNKYLKEE